MAKLDLKIFSVNRIRFSELYTDAVQYIKDVYNANNQEFSLASPFAIMVNIIIELGRMILFYIENSINEMNIGTAYQSRSIRGLSILTGHNPSRGVASRGTLKMSYNMASEYTGETIYINNYTKIKNTSNGLSYIAAFPTDVLQLTVGAYDYNMELSILQGELNYQQATGTGEALQSFNFVQKNDVIIDDFFCNVYVNGKKWENVKSILDMTYEQEACMIRTSVNNGIDVFFGDGNNGKIPVVGATILFEYLLTSGPAGNVQKDSEEATWEFVDSGYDANDNEINLNEIYSLSSESDIIFGSYGEDLSLTRLLAPNASRSFVLANTNNYKTFLSKLNMFSIIDAFSGFRTESDMRIEESYNNAKAAYLSSKDDYAREIKLSGKDSPTSQQLLTTMNECRSKLEQAKIKYDESKMDDNTIYLYLVPDIQKRLGDYENYFTCDESRFKLSDDEKTGIINLIDYSGQKVMTVENKIIDPVYARFSINIFIQLWSSYNFNSIKSEIVSQVSDYLIKTTRRDRIPISDIISIIENIDGVDSVNAYFDADKNNEVYYGSGNYGIDEYGDVVLTRNMQDILGNSVIVRDIQPLFKGGFTSMNDVYYDTGLESINGPINITLRGTTQKI